MVYGIFISFEGRDYTEYRGIKECPQCHTQTIFGIKVQDQASYCEKCNIMIKINIPQNIRDLFTEDSIYFDRSTTMKKINYHNLRYSNFK